MPLLRIVTDQEVDFLQALAAALDLHPGVRAKKLQEQRQPFLLLVAHGLFDDNQLVHNLKGNIKLGLSKKGQFELVIA